MNVDAALAYAAKHELHALLVATGDRVVHESYANGCTRGKPHALYSGTKSFWGIAALEAQRDGLFSIDERIAATLPELAAGERSAVTVRMLLTMSAGYGFGGLGNAVPTYEKALGIALKSPPGTVFTYGGIPLQIFGAFFAQKLAGRRLTPHEYLRAKVLEPAGVDIGAWRTLSDGTHPLPTGAQLTARAWLAYGTYVLRHRRRYAPAFEGCALNPRYGLCWWLSAPGLPEDLFYASGSGGQGLYVIPSQEAVVVHFGNSASYKHEAFLKRLLS